MGEIATNSGLIQRDRVGIQVRFRMPGYLDKHGRWYVRPEDLEWTVLYVVPQLMCTNCSGICNEVPIDPTVCGRCVESWFLDYLANPETTDIDLMAWMLQRVI